MSVKGPARASEAAPPTSPELRRPLLGLMLGRAAVLTLLLGCGIVVERLLPQAAVRIRWFYALTGAGYALTALYSIFSRWWLRHRAAAYLQLGGDLLLVTGLVYATGGVDSPFSVLYFTVIIAASILLRRRGAFFTATASFLSYGLLVLLIVYDVLPVGPAWADEVLLGDVSAMKLVVYSLVAHFLAFFAVALLSSMLSENLYRAGRELRERTEDLVRLQALSKNIVDSIASGVITTDLTGKITFVNRGGEEILGGRAEQFQNRAVWQVFGRDEGLLAEVSEEISSGQRIRLEAEIERPGGDPITLGVTCSVLKDPRGNPTGFIFAFQNLTDIKALEEEVKVKDRMAALGEVAAGMAHEIRNPLASISGSAQLLKKSVEPSDADAELFDIIVREGQRLDRIIHDFLLFARPGRFQPKRADLVPILRESLLLIRNGGDCGAQHRIEADLPAEGVPCRVDVNLIRQVFWNLAKNALRAMPGGGTLRVTASRSAGGDACVVFEDTGIGMSREEIEAAFQPFRGRFDGGTGLGLAIVFRVVQEHGGRIQVRSEPGAGSRFTILLPMARARDALAETPGPAAAAR
ncbi:MAG TPA: ATP-binding protein [Candidatus Saccharimonadales bacterium]|nr:ATP-binding protein [Candidatus Saccharimonadales bacterium]